MTRLSERAQAGGTFILGNHGCCGVPGIRDHSKEGLQRSWWLGQGSLIDIIVNRGGQLLLSHDTDVALTQDDAVLFEEVADWARGENAFLCLNLLQTGETGLKGATRVFELAKAYGLTFAICSADGALLRQMKGGLDGTDTVYMGGCDENILKEAVKAKCSGVIVDCREPDFDIVKDLFQKNKRKKKDKMVFLAHIASDFECAPWCAILGMPFICDDPLEAVNAMMNCGQ